MDGIVLVLATEHPERDEWVDAEATKWQHSPMGAVGGLPPYRGVWLTARPERTPVHLFASHSAMREIVDPTRGDMIRAEEPDLSDARRGQGGAHVWGGNRPTEVEAPERETAASRTLYGHVGPVDGPRVRRFLGIRWPR